MRQRSKPHILCSLSLFSILGLMATGHFWSSHGQATLSSHNNTTSFSDITRSTELKDIVPSDKSPEKEVEIIMKDPAINKNWGLNSTEAQHAWRLTRGSRDIIVAVIDTGIDVHHPDLKNNLWVNTAEKNGKKGVDDDGNGYIDDIYGFNFVHNNGDVTDSHGHGTHIAGIIGAEGGNGIGISGVAPRVSLMALKYYDPQAPGLNNLNNTVKAIDYAVKNGAHIINYSGGGLESSPEEQAAIDRARRQGVLFVAAAGNERSNSDVKGYYPANYDLPNIISVTAIDKEQNVLSTSNWGANSVDLAAPGNDIYSTLPGGKYGTSTGTSQATAFVSGVAALIMAHNPELRHADRIAKYLTQTGDLDNRLAGKTRHTRKLNSYRALAIQDGDLSFAGTHTANMGGLDRTAFSSDPNIQQDLKEHSPEAQLALGGQEVISFLNRQQPQTEDMPPATSPQL